MTKSPSSAVKIGSAVFGLFAKTVVSVCSLIFVVTVFGFSGVIANGVADMLLIPHYNFAQIAGVAGLLGFIWKECQ